MQALRILSATLVLAALSHLAIAADGDNATGRVIVGPPNPVQYLYEVQLTAIDGERILPRDMLTLEPGDYVLTARVPAQYTEPLIRRHHVRRPVDMDFSLTVEPGRDYSVRVKWNPHSLATPFELVVSPYE